MAEDWRTACWRAEREVEEYKGTIVPDLVEKVRVMEEQNKRLERMNKMQSVTMGKLHDELCFTRMFIHKHGLEFALAEAWRVENGKPHLPVTEAERK